MNLGERSIRARIAAFSPHAQRDSREVTRPARERFMGRFDDEVDPARAVPDDERRRRAGWHCVGP